MDKERLQKFLKLIQMLESSGGKDTEHPVIESGLHTGDAAIGGYGIMPNTAKELVNRRRLQGAMPEHLAPIQTMSTEEVSGYLQQNPQYQQELAEQLGQKVLDQYGGDEEQAAYSWQHGHNIQPEKMKELPYKDSDRVQKYNMYKQMLEQGKLGEE